MVGVGLIEGVKLIVGVGLDEGMELPAVVGIGRVEVGLGREVELPVAVCIGKVEVGLGPGVELGVAETDPEFMVMALTIQAGSDPPASENSSDNEPPDTETIKVLTAKPPTVEFTSPRTVVPLALATISSWA